MNPELRVRSWTAGSDEDRRSGLLGFVAIEFHGLVLDSIVVRRTSDGRFALSFPGRTDRAGRRHAYIRPADNATRQEFERQILWQLGERAEFLP